MGRRLDGIARDLASASTREAAHGRRDGRKRQDDLAHVPAWRDRPSEGHARRPSSQGELVCRPFLRAWITDVFDPLDLRSRSRPRPPSFTQARSVPTSSSTNPTRRPSSPKSSRRAGSDLTSTACPRATRPCSASVGSASQGDSARGWRSLEQFTPEQTSSSSTTPFRHSTGRPKRKVGCNSLSCCSVSR